MNGTDKQILKALIYIKENPNCSANDSDNISDKIVHYLYQSDLVDTTDSKTIHMQEDEYGYCYIKITPEGEVKIQDIKKQSSPLRMFSNKTVRFVVATVFTSIIGIASTIFVFNYQKSHEQPIQQEKQSVLLEEKPSAQK